MRVFKTPQDMKAAVGEEIGVSDWITVDQKTIDTFAEATGDHQWIHVDVERAKKELPGGKTIAHGWLTASLIPRMSHQIYKIESRTHGFNYGSNRVRFINQVPAGSRIRLRHKLKAVEPRKDGGYQLTNEYTVEIEGQEKPACVAETLGVVYG